MLSGIPVGLECKYLECSLHEIRTRIKTHRMWVGVWGYYMLLFIRYFEICVKGEPLVMVSLRISPKT